MIPFRCQLSRESLALARSTENQHFTRLSIPWHYALRVPSDAHADWIGQRQARLAELFAAHATIGGSGRGRRWRTSQLNWALTLRIAGEFQGYARDLHTLAVGHFRTGDVLQVVVRLTVPDGGGDEHPTVVLPADSVMPLSDDRDLPAPGTWLPGFRYERGVAGALVRVLADSEAAVYLNLERSGKEIDILVESHQGVIVGEVKSGDPLTEHSFAAGVRHLYAVMKTCPGAKGLLLTRGALPPSVGDRLRTGGLLSPDVGVVRWRGPQDDKRLDLVIHSLLGDDTGQRKATDG